MSPRSREEPAPRVDTKVSAGDSLVIGCLAWLVVIGACVIAAVIAITMWMTRR